MQEHIQQALDNLQNLADNTTQILQDLNLLETSSISEKLEQIKQEAIEVVSDLPQIRDTQTLLQEVDTKIQEAKEQIQQNLAGQSQSLQELKEEAINSITQALNTAKEELRTQQKTKRLPDVKTPSAQNFAMWLEGNDIFVLGDKTSSGGVGSNGRGGFADSYGGLPTRVAIPSNENISKLYAFNKNFFAVCEDKRNVYVWGENGGSGLLGVGNNAFVYTPKKITLPAEVEKIHCMDFVTNESYATTMFLLKNGNLLGIGKNGAGHLGTGNNIDSSQPISTLFANIKDFCVFNGNASYSTNAYFTTFAIDTQGRLFVCGANTYGQLALGNTTNINTPTHNDYIVYTDSQEYYPIKKVFGFCGTSAIIANDNKAWLSGYNGYRHLTTGDTTNKNRFVRLTNTDNQTLENVKDIILDYNCSFAILENGDLYAWGLGTYGYGGTTTTANQKAHKVLEGVESIKCMQGIDGSYNRHCFIAKKTDGTLWAFGYTPSYFGFSGESAFKQFRQIDIGEVQDFYCNYTGVIVLKDNEIYAGNPLVDSHTLQRITRS